MTTHQQKQLRNIGISAHIDSGKTTLTERMLYYCGRVHKMREVHGGGGATMDSDPVERKRGITIKSAATTIHWRDYQINVIDTPGHVDFTIEVERSLRVLDGAVLVLCSVGGVQSQSLTVDRQMRRYGVPRIAMINKMDRMGADPSRVIEEMRTKLKTNAVAIQIPIGLESNFQGIVDLITMKAVYFDGENGEIVRRTCVPPELLQQTNLARTEMLESLALLDDRLMQSLLAQDEISENEIRSVIRRATLAQQLTPVVLGSAYQNKGVQEVLDAIIHYLPSPEDREYFAMEHSDSTEPEPVRLESNDCLPMVAMAFKTVVEKFGQLTYLRIYQGKLEKGSTYRNSRTQQQARFGRIVRIHANQYEDIEAARAGEIVGILGINCASGDTFTDPEIHWTLNKMLVADPVVKLSIAARNRKDSSKLAKALEQFRRDDPTFHVSTDPESGETLIAGMGQLHLEVYIEKIENDFDCPCLVGKPNVAYQERPTCSVDFSHRLKKMNGGPGQFAQISGRMELVDDSTEEALLFDDEIVGGRIEQKFINAVREGLALAMEKGPLGRFEVVGMKVTLEDGAQHEKDSNEFAFKNCASEAMRKVILPQADVALWEPIVRLEVSADLGLQGAISADLSRKRGLIKSSTVSDGEFTIVAEVPLAELFDFANELRSMTRGTGSFQMSPSGFKQVPRDIETRVLMERNQ